MPADPSASGQSPSSAVLDRGYCQVRYEAVTTGRDRGGASPALEAWLRSGALAPCRILVPGCGRGHEAVVLARAGFRVTGLDYAPGAGEVS